MLCLYGYFRNVHLSMSCCDNVTHIFLTAGHVVFLVCTLLSPEAYAKEVNGGEPVIREASRFNVDVQ